MTPEQALSVIERERLDVLAEGMTEAECQQIAAYVLATEYRKRILGPNDAQTLALIEDRRLTVTWHFNGHHVQAICYDHKGNNRTSSVDLGIAVAECIKRCDATGTPQEKP